MFNYQKGFMDNDVSFVMMLLVLVAVFWFGTRALTEHSESNETATAYAELNEALTNSGIMCKPIKVNEKWYCAKGIIVKSDDGTEQHPEEIDK